MSGILSGWRRLAAWILVACLVVSACGRGGDDEKGSAAQASDPKDPKTIAFLRAVASTQPENQQAFLDELERGGYVVGQNLTLRAEAMEEVHADEASARAAVDAWRVDGVDLIVALSTMGAAVARDAAPDTQVLFLVNDPVAAGLVSDVRHPEGRLTGATFFVPPDRTLDVARRALPGAEVIGAVYPPGDPAAVRVADDAQRAATALGMKLVTATFTSADDAGAAVESVRSQGAAAVWVLNTPTTVRFAQPLLAAARSASLPVVSNTSVVPAVVTLQPDTIELYRQMARQALQLFAGTPVRDVPVENPAKFVVAVSLVAAAEVGVSIPQAFLDRADRVVR
ncbi:MAG TPA: ABC transporter substrate-binding protein [Acidimicrobiales bacterium]|nr:ABC transporter substrate-binding protein [Acidimicrobiales bacterium]